MSAPFKAGVRSAIEMALITAITIEVRADANDMRQRAAVAALRGLAEGLKSAFLDQPQTKLTNSPSEASV